VRFGAPPDLFNSAGQNWGMAPINPLHLRDNAYAPFIEMLRANMRYAGALRIDHVMALEQLYWIPDGEENSAGAYVRYPFDDLLAIVALESHRNRCFVIGEDLGTVPSNFRERMAAENILSYRVSQFERHPDGLYFRPSVYPDLALATATTHDLPTIRGHWQETDIHIRHELAANASPEDLKAQLAERAHDRDLLRAALVDQGLVDKKFPLTADLQDGDLEILIAAVERFVARTPSRLLLANLTDLLAEDDLLNLPGTIDEYPNWRRKLRLATNDLSADPTVRAAADAILAERP
ncbi:MAG: 4-alpha-glucanotransferase, partial [Rhodospirillales bacterium]|nr:4-alpha-glucanotransferase [Rhodospirillales bacterium]